MSFLALGASLIGGLLQSRSARRATRSQEQSANQQNDLAREIFNRQTTLFEPYRRSGQRAMNALGSELGLNSAPEGFQGYMQSPNYNYLFEQGQRGIDGSAAAQGNLFSSATLDRQQERGTALAQQDYGNYLSRLAGMSTMGQSSVAQQANAAGNFGSASANAISGLGNARAAGAIAQGNAINTGLSNAVGAFGYMQQRGGGGNLFGGGAWS